MTTRMILYYSNRMPQHLLLLAAALLSACAHRSASGTFRVVPASPEYLLRTPDSKQVTFPEVLSSYNGYVAGKEWMDLRPRMELRVENAYYQNGAPRRGLAGYLGTAIARYQVRTSGLRLSSVQSGIESLPPGQTAVQDLIRPAQLRQRFYRFFYAVVFKQRADARGSVLLGAGSVSELDRIARQLAADPDALCSDASPHCIVFPSACTVSVEMEILVNGTARSVAWATPLVFVAGRSRRVELLRAHSGRLTPVEIDLKDPNALRLPLLPGDRITLEQAAP